MTARPACGNRPHKAEVVVTTLVAGVLRGHLCLGCIGSYRLNGSAVTVLTPPPARR